MLANVVVISLDDLGTCLVITNPSAIAAIRRLWKNQCYPGSGAGCCDRLIEASLEGH
jgi:hypothetical protein